MSYFDHPSLPPYLRDHHLFLPLLLPLLFLFAAAAHPFPSLPPSLPPYLRYHHLFLPLLLPLLVFFSATAEDGQHAPPLVF